MKYYELLVPEEGWCLKLQNQMSLEEKLNYGGTLSVNESMILLLR